MHKLSGKFITGIIFILTVSTICSILTNTQFVERYYLSQKGKSLQSISQLFTHDIQNGSAADDAITLIEEKEKVLIVKIDSIEAADVDTINEEIRDAFQDKGIGFQTYWLWDKDYSQVMDQKNITRLYHQDKLNYGLLVEYIRIGETLYAVTMIVPDIGDAFTIINTFYIAVNIAAIVIAILFICLLVKKITTPLKAFEAFALSMGQNRFTPLEINTNDELESLAENLNFMGKELICYQSALLEKNTQMEQLLDSVAHDLKTPVSLIHLYISGIKDGMDDGTFLETIDEQNQQMSEMIEQLLYMSRIQKSEMVLEDVSLTQLLTNLIKKYSVLSDKRNVTIGHDIEQDLTVPGNQDLLCSLFTNLITNAVKYTSGLEIYIHAWSNAQNICVTIQNETDNPSLDTKQIWSPYYVGEDSRSKEISGTGLGLSIVKSICEKLQYDIQCELISGKIVFMVVIPK